MTQTHSNQRSRRTLVLAYVFPPAGGAGVQRVTKFVKYLPEFGWDCSVLTVANPSVPVFDDSLADEIPEGTVVRRARTLEPGYALKNVVSAGAASESQQQPGLLSRTKRWLKQTVRNAGNAILQPDAQILWYPAAVKEGMNLLAEQPHDAIFVTAPPFSAFVIGAELSRRSGLPLVIDYRDEWGISNRYQENRQKSGLSHWLQNRMQRRVLRQASAIVATTRRSTESVAETASAAGTSPKVTAIYNGYDAADIGLPALPDNREAAADRKLRLAYVGTLWNLTSIEPIVAALLRLEETSPEIAERIELVVAGRVTAEQGAILDRLLATSCSVTREGYVDHARAIEIMRSADAQCLLLSDVAEAERVVPAKTFEYLALQRPILSIVPTGEVSEILADCPFAASFTPDDVAGIARYLERRVEAECLAGLPADEPQSLPTADWSVSRFERRHLTGELADVLNSVCGLAPSRASEAAATPETLAPAESTEVQPTSEDTLSLATAGTGGSS